MVPDGWHRKSLAELCDKPVSYGIVQTGRRVEKGVPCLRVIDLTRREMSLGNMITTSPEIHQAYKRTTLEVGDIVMALRGEIGLAKLVDYEVAGANITRGLARISANREHALPEFLLWEIRSPGFRADLIRRVGGSALQEISLSELRKTKTLVPPIGEQRKIAKILSAWDEAIATTEQLLANSEQQKKALMQQLLTGKKRLMGFGKPGAGRFGRKALPEGWTYERIGDFAEEVADRNKEREEIPVLSCSKYHGFVDSLKYFKKKVYSDDTSNYKIIRLGEFGFPANHVEEGSIGLQCTYERGIVSPIYIVFRVDPGKVDEFFLYKILKTDHYRQVFSSSTSASVDRRGSLRWKPFSDIKVPLPSLEEQKAIGRVIQAAEKEEAVIEQSLKKLCAEKRALMQQLLTGKRRVKVDEAERATA